MTGFWLLLYLVWTPLLGLPYPPPLLGAQASAVHSVPAQIHKIRIFLFSFDICCMSDPDCLVIGCSGGGGSCGWRHLVPVPALLADRRRIPQEGEVPAAGADVHPGDESAVLGTAANQSIDSSSLLSLMIMASASQ